MISPPHILLLWCPPRLSSRLSALCHVYNTTQYSCFISHNFSSPSIHQKGPKSTHITPILKFLQWLKINKCIKYKLLSLTYKVLTTVQPSYLHNLISLQPTRSTRSSSVVTLSRPPTISSLKITDHSLRYASPRLWNQLPDSFHQPHHSRLDSPPHPLLNSSLSSSPLSSSFTLSLKAQNLPFQQILPTVDFFYLLDCLTTTGLDRTYHAHHFIFSFTF